MNRIFFTPGPSALYYTVDQHIKNALKENVPSINHRGSEYVKIHQSTVENLKTLLNLPDNFNIGFTSSATEIWERSIENLVDKKSFHFVNGSFSEKFYSVAQSLGKEAILAQSAFGSNNDILNTEIPSDVELITLAQNETSTGAALPVEEIEKLKDKYPNPLLAVDSVSSLPSVKFDFSKVDSLYFSVQKCMGLPAGLGVWIYNDRCLDKAKRLQKEGKYYDTYNGLLSIDKFAQKHQTSCTPNVLNIYLLGKVVEDMLTRGIDQIRTDAAYKSALIYNLFENHPQLTPFVKEKKYRSLTVGVAEVQGGSDTLIKKLTDKGLIVGNGYSEFKGKQIRIANFPTHSREQIELLIDTINGLEF